jgi:hypothetical protein
MGVQENMMRAALILVAVVALTPGVAWAASPSPSASGVMYHKVAMPLTNPGNGKQGQPTMGGAGCIGPHANAGQTAVNPVSGKPQPAPIIAIPLNGGNVASATNRAQQSYACGHASH